MKKALLLSLALLSVALGRAETYIISTAHSQIRFSVKKWSVLDVEGLFRSFHGTIRYRPDNPEESTVEVSVDVASLVTGEPKRDESLAMPEFLDVARHPTMSFKSDVVRKEANGTLLAKGFLTIKGTSRVVPIRVQLLGVQQIPGEGEVATFAAEFTIDRRDFGVLGGTLSRTMVGNEVRIRLTLAGKRQRGAN